MDDVFAAFDNWLFAQWLKYSKFKLILIIESWARSVLKVNYALIQQNSVFLHYFLNLNFWLEHWKIHPLVLEFLHILIFLNIGLELLDSVHIFLFNYSHLQHRFVTLLRDKILHYRFLVFSIAFITIDNVTQDSLVSIVYEA